MRPQSLIGHTTVDSEIAKEQCFTSLPVNIQPTVTALLEYTPLRQAALIADKILARISTGDSYIVASTSRSNLDVDASHFPAHGDRGGCIHTRLNFRDRSDAPETHVPKARSRSRKAVTTHTMRASPKSRRKWLRNRVRVCDGSTVFSGPVPPVVELPARTTQKTPEPASKSRRTRRPLTPGLAFILCSRLSH